MRIVTAPADVQRMNDMTARAAAEVIMIVSGVGMAVAEVSMDRVNTVRAILSIAVENMVAPVMEMTTVVNPATIMGSAEHPAPAMVHVVSVVGTGSPSGMHTEVMITTTVVDGIVKVVKATSVAPDAMSTAVPRAVSTARQVDGEKVAHRDTVEKIIVATIRRNGEPEDAMVVVTTVPVVTVPMEQAAKGPVAVTAQVATVSAKETHAVVDMARKVEAI
jgi:hypothetical protein